jgi:SAM-dependent methyltransferase
VATRSRDSPFRREFFDRVDASDDELFYAVPRLVAHIDDDARARLAAHYAEVLAPDTAILDLMSSCVSHLPADVTFAAVTGLGMNAVELDANPRLTARVVHNLNREPRLPFTDAAFDACLIAVSIQYLTQPVAVLAEVARILKPAAPCVVSYSNRMFPTKAVAVWRAVGDRDHAGLIAAYFDAAGGFAEPTFAALRPATGIGDPLYAVTARRIA